MNIQDEDAEELEPADGAEVVVDVTIGVVGVAADEEILDGEMLEVGG